MLVMQHLSDHVNFAAVIHTSLNSSFITPVGEKIQGLPASVQEDLMFVDIFRLLLANRFRFLVNDDKLSLPLNINKSIEKAYSSNRYIIMSFRYN